MAGSDAGVASGLMSTSQQIGGAIGVAVASTVAATHSRLLLSQGHSPAAALTGGFQWVLWVCGLVGLAAVPVTFLLVRRTELARAVASARQQKAPATAPPADAVLLQARRAESPDRGSAPRVPG